MKIIMDGTSWRVFPETEAEKLCLYRSGWLERVIKEAIARESRGYYVMLRLDEEDAEWLRARGANRTIKSLVLADGGKSAWAGADGRLKGKAGRVSVRVEVRDPRVRAILDRMESRQAYCAELISQAREEEII